VARHSVIQKAASRRAPPQIYEAEMEVAARRVRVRAASPPAGTYCAAAT
jgi:hypothetical protein